VTTRREARTQALEVLYEADSRNEAPAAALARRDGVDPYAEELVQGVSADHDEIDRMITEHARNWELEQMAVVDRNALRLALYELRAGAVPPAVVMDEAVELCRMFSTEEGGRFVNGILAAVAADSSNFSSLLDPDQTPR
jgi:N utilization substance protein B